MSLFLITLASLLVGCATPATDDFNTLVQLQDPIAVNEYVRSERLLDRLEQTGMLLNMTDVEAYLASLLTRLYPEQKKQHRIRIARLPGENAFALSNGVVVIHLSLLAALENEHQLAFVLAHEFEHVNARHGYLGAHLRRQARVKAHLADLVMLGSGVSYSYYAGGLRQVNREQELEADRRAASVLIQAGFDLTEAARFFDVLKNYENPVQLLEQKGTHPDNQQRKQALLTMARDQADARPHETGDLLKVVKQRDGHHSLRQQLLQRSVEEKIADLDFLSALVQIDALEKYQKDQPAVHCLQGEVFYQMAITRPQAYADVVLVKDMREHAGFELPVVFTDASSRAYFLNRSTNEFKALEGLQPDSDCSVRGLGVTSLAIGQHAEARRYLRRYLRLNPSAHDRRYILGLLKTSAAPL